MRKVVVIYCVVVFLCGFNASAQQDPQFSMNMYNHMFINPGYAGNNGAICATAINRQQWMGFEGAPKTMLFSANMPFEFPDKITHGAGINIYSDKLGFEGNFGLNLAYAYRFMKVGPGDLGVGIGLGMLNKSLDAEWIPPDYLNPDKNSGWSNDPSIPDPKDSHTVLDLNFGAFYGANNFYVGLSTSHINQAEIKYSSIDSAMPFVKRHYYIESGYVIDRFMGQPKLSFIPSIFIKTDGPTVQIDGNAIMEYNKTLWGGISYRVQESIITIIGVTLPMNLKLGFAYDFNISKLHPYNKGSIEFFANYCFNIIKNNKKGSYRSVRY